MDPRSNRTKVWWGPAGDGPVSKVPSPLNRRALAIKFDRTKKRSLSNPSKYPSLAAPLRSAPCPRWSRPSVASVRQRDRLRSHNLASTAQRPKLIIKIVHGERARRNSPSCALPLQTPRSKGGVSRIFRCPPPLRDTCVFSHLPQGARSGDGSAWDVLTVRRKPSRHTASKKP